MSAKYHINPRIRAYGKARIDITRRASDEREWQSKWRAPLHPYPFTPGRGWMFSVEYKVDDFAAEVGFYIDVLGFEVHAFSPSYAQFTDPDNNFLFGVSAAKEGEESTDPDSIRLQLNVGNIFNAVKMLEERGVAFEQKPVPVPGHPDMVVGYFRSPHGVCFDLFGDIVLDDDDEDYPKEDEQDEAEANRLIEEILGLADDTDADEEDEEIINEDETEEEERERDYLDLISQPNPKSQKVTHRSFPTHTNPYPALSSRRRSVALPPRNGKQVGELTYQEIEDETGPTDLD